MIGKRFVWTLKPMVTQTTVQYEPWAVAICISEITELCLTHSCQLTTVREGQKWYDINNEDITVALKWAAMVLSYLITKGFLSNASTHTL